MKARDWKNIIDSIDEDLVSSAAERFGKGHYSREDPSEYPADRHPKEYYVQRPVKKPHKGWWISAGAAAAAAVGIAVVLKNTSLLSNIIAPLQSQTSPTSASDSRAVSYKEGSTGGVNAADTAIDFDVFEKCFVGCWTNGATSLELSYGTLSGSFNNGTTSEGKYTCVSLKEAGSGYELLALDSTGSYDLWYVSEQNMAELTIYRQIDTNGSSYRSPSEGLTCGSTEKYTKNGIPDESAVLGYFGMEKLAQEMGVSSDSLYNLVYSDAESGETLVTQEWFVERATAEDSVELTVAFYTSDYSKSFLYDVVWEKSEDGKWSYTVYPDSCSIMNTEFLFFEDLTEDQLTIFEECFFGLWSMDGETYDLSYYRDFFNADEEVRLWEDENGWWMSKAPRYDTTLDDSVWFISKDNMDEMLHYTADPSGFVITDEYDALYTRVGEATEPGVRYSVLGLYHVLFNKMNDIAVGLVEYIWEFSVEDENGEEWATSYNAGYDSFDGYRVVERDGDTLDLYWQVYNVSGEYKWYMLSIIITDDGYEGDGGVFVDEEDVDALERTASSTTESD